MEFIPFTDFTPRTARQQNSAKMRFLESAKLEIGTFFVGVVMEVAKQELALSTLEARHPLCNRLQGNLRSCHDAVVTQSLRSRYAVVTQSSD